MNTKTQDKRSILEEAHEITSGERRRDYGHPSNGHSTTAQLWSTYISQRVGFAVPLDHIDVCMLNILQKISRHAVVRKRDNLVDIVGYIRNIEMILEQENG
jgi:hypothetical protein